MSRTELKACMRKTGKTPLDIAAALKIDPITVKRYLKGKKVRPIVEEGFRKFVEANTPTQKDPSAEVA